MNILSIKSNFKISDVSKRGVFVSGSYINTSSGPVKIEDSFFRNVKDGDFIAYKLIVKREYSDSVSVSYQNAGDIPDKGIIFQEVDGKTDTYMSPESSEKILLERHEKLLTFDAPIGIIRTEYQQLANYVLLRRDETKAGNKNSVEWWQEASAKTLYEIDKDGNKSEYPINFRPRLKVDEDETDQQQTDDDDIKIRYDRLYYSFYCMVSRVKEFAKNPGVLEIETLSDKGGFRFEPNFYFGRRLIFTR